MFESMTKVFHHIYGYMHHNRRIEGLTSIQVFPITAFPAIRDESGASQSRLVLEGRKFHPGQVGRFIVKSHTERQPTIHTLLISPTCMFFDCGRKLLRDMGRRSSTQKVPVAVVHNLVAVRQHC